MNETAKPWYEHVIDAWFYRTRLVTSSEIDVAFRMRRMNARGVIS